MALTVPKPQVEILKQVAQLPDEQLQGFLRALTDAGPQFNVEDLATAVTARLNLPTELASAMVRILGSLYLLKDSQNLPTDIFVEQELRPALLKAGLVTSDSAQPEWKKLSDYFATGLSLEDTVGTAAKAGHILTQHEHIFSNARILTDIRPIFHVSVDEKPKAAILVHMLRIQSRDDHGHRSDRYFALDSNDVRSLKIVIDRAIKKEATLKGLMADAKITLLDPKATY